MRFSKSLPILLLWPALCEAQLALPGASATQSSQFETFAASNAIDGDPGTISHTALDDANPSWTLDFGADVEVSHFRIFNRVDCCQERLRNVRVRLLDADGNALWDTGVGDLLLNRDNHLGGPAFLELSAPDVVARRVEVSRAITDEDPASGDRVLSIGEFQFFGGNGVVTNLDDDGPGSLRQTLREVAPGGTVTFDPSLDDGFLILTSGAIVIDKLVHIDASALPAGITITPIFGSRIFEFPPAPAVAGLATALATSSSFIDGPDQPVRFPPSNALDGVLDNFTHTYVHDPAPTWGADLSRSVLMDTLRLHNRQDCCQSRLSDLRVRLFDATGALAWESGLINPGDVLGGPASIDVDFPATAVRRIEIGREISPADPANPTDDEVILSLGEVEASLRTTPVTLRNLTMERGRAPDGVGNGHGGAVFAQRNLSLTGCTFLYNTAGFGGRSDDGMNTIAGDGGAIYCEGDLFLDGCVFEGNSAGDAPESDGGSGGAVFVEGSLAAQGCEFEINFAGSAMPVRPEDFFERDGGGDGGDGGAVHLVGPGSFTDCTFHWNASGEGARDGEFVSGAGVAGMGGAVSLEGDSVTFLRCLFFANQATDGGEGRAFNGSRDAGLPGEGGAIHAVSTAVSIQSCHFSYNSAGRGGDMLDPSLGRPRGTGGGRGGAVFLDSGTAELLSSTFDNNRAGDGGHGLFGSAGGNGGAVALINTASAQITGCTFTVNEAGEGGRTNRDAIGETNPIGGDGGSGGAVFSNGTGTAILHCFFSRNRAGTAYAGTAGNSDGGNGGAVALSGTGATITGSTIAENWSGLLLPSASVPSDPAPFACYGAGISLRDATDVTISNCTITGNRLGGSTTTDPQGAGIAVLNGGGQISIDSCTIVDNLTNDSAVPGFRRGGHPAIFSNNSFTASNCLVARNLGVSSQQISLTGQVVESVVLFSDDPLLTPLGDFGGPVPTRVPLPGSPAIDAGAAGELGSSLDQRGLPRFVGGFRDAGAVEFQGEESFLFADADGDGHVFLMEQALGTDPDVVDACHPHNPNLSLEAADGPRTISFGRNPDALPGTVWVLERSTDLIDFEEIYRFDGDTATHDPDVIATEHADSFTIIDSSLVGDRAFYRFRGTLAPPAP